MAAIHVTSTEHFDKQLVEAGSKLVLVDFHATWCGPCRNIAPTVEKLAAELADSLVVLKVDVDEIPDLTERYGISSMPTFLFIKNKETLETFAGANNDKLTSTVQKYL